MRLREDSTRGEELVQGRYFSGGGRDALGSRRHGRLYNSDFGAVASSRFRVWPRNSRGSRPRVNPLTEPISSTSTATQASALVPTIAIVGRPNVGKSTLFNRIVGSRRAIVGDEPGITRDRLYGNAEWEGRQLRIVDTGGILPEEKDLIPSEIYRQARGAFDEDAAIAMV